MYRKNQLKNQLSFIFLGSIYIFVCLIVNACFWYLLYNYIFVNTILHEFNYTLPNVSFSFILMFNFIYSTIKIGAGNKHKYDTIKEAYTKGFLIMSSKLFGLALTYIAYLILI